LKALSHNVAPDQCGLLIKRLLHLVRSFYEGGARNKEKKATEKTQIRWL
jgi:hypothetical protein